MGANRKVIVLIALVTIALTACKPEAQLSQTMAVQPLATTQPQPSQITPPPAVTPNVLISADLDERSALKYNSAPADHLSILINSVVLHGGFAIASTDEGLFRASSIDKKWYHLECPPALPVMGRFVYQSNPVNTILFITTSGLYGSNDNGQTWSLLSNAYNFQSAFLHNDRSLYAIVTTKREITNPPQIAQDIPWQVTKPDGEQYYIRDIIIVSKDFGRTWQDITGNIPAGVRLYGVFQDPDHSDLVVLLGNSIRNYIFQSSDKSYDWQMSIEWIWSSSHAKSEDDFFQKGYSTQTILFELPGTLGNYFAHSFGSSPYLPAFDIALGQNAYEFTPADKKFIEVSIVFLEEQDAPVLVDIRDSSPLWGVRVITPTGQRIEVPVTSDRLSRDAHSKGETLMTNRTGADFERFIVSKKQSYTRLLNLDSLTDFSAVGVYKVQLIYDDSFLADRNQGEWVGMFASNVFTVTIVQ